MKKQTRINGRPIKLSSEEYLAIDQVPRYKHGDGTPLNTAISRAKKEAAPWKGDQKEELNA